jgi:hypothetical protein
VRKVPQEKRHKRSEDSNEEAEIGSKEYEDHHARKEWNVAVLVHGNDDPIHDSGKGNDPGDPAVQECALWGGATTREE